MFGGLTVGAVIPAYNVEQHIAGVIAGLPPLVDSIILVDDAGRDATAAVAAATRDRRLVQLRHPVNRGVGGAIVTGYREAQRRGLDIAVVVAGDGQMDPDDLPSLLFPLARGQADYVKGNRFAHPDLLRTMPWLRLAGNAALSLLTRVTSGYPGVIDSQCGYTALRLALLDRIDLERVYPRYGFPNDFLAHLHSAGGRLAQVTVRPVYRGERSGINPLLSVGPLSYVLARSLALRRTRRLRSFGELQSSRTGDDNLGPATTARR